MNEPSLAIKPQSTGQAGFPLLPFVLALCGYLSFLLLYHFLHLPLQNYLIGCSVIVGLSVTLFIVPFPSFVFPNHTNWLPKVFIPSIGLVSAVVHRMLGLKGGTFAEIGLVLGSAGLSVLLTTNLIFSIPNKSSSILTRLIPITLIALSVVITPIMYFIRKSDMMIFLLGIIFLLICSIAFLYRNKHYLLLGTTAFVVAIWPIIFLIQKIMWLVESLGVILVVFAYFRMIKFNTYPKVQAKLIYFIGGIYLIWLTLSLLITPNLDQINVYQIITGITQLVFLFGVLQNLHDKSDHLSFISGFAIGTLTVMALMLKSLWEQVVHFNALNFIAVGIRATVGNVNPNFTIQPVLVFSFLVFAILITKKKTTKYLALITFLFCLWMIFLSGSRAAQIALFAGIFSMTMTQPKLRKLVITGILGIIVLLTIAYIINSTATSILLRTRGFDSGRFELWQIAWEKIRGHLLMGFGPNTGSFLFSEFANQHKVSGTFWYGGGKIHSIFFTELFESGLIGLFLLIMVYYFIWQWIRNIEKFENSPWKLAANSIFIAFVLRGVFESTGFLFVHSNLGECYPPLFAMIVAAGETFNKRASPLNVKL